MSEHRHFEFPEIDLPEAEIETSSIPLPRRLAAWIAIATFFLSIAAAAGRDWVSTHERLDHVETVLDQRGEMVRQMGEKLDAIADDVHWTRGYIAAHEHDKESH